MKGISNCEIRIADCTTTMDKNPEWGGRGDWGEGIGNCGEDLRKPIGRKRVGWWNEKIEVRIANVAKQVVAGCSCCFGIRPSKVLLSDPPSEIRHFIFAFAFRLSQSAIPSLPFAFRNPKRLSKRAYHV